MNNRNLQLIYNKGADLILRIEVVDEGRRKVFRSACSITDKKRLRNIFEFLKIKFNIEIPRKLKKDVTGWDSLCLG